MTAREFIANLECVKKSGAGWVARCPAHDDKHASLSVGKGEGDRLLLKCHAGCEFESIIAAVSNNSGSRQELIRYPYCDESGETLYESVRINPKGFYQRKPDGNGGWQYKLNGVRRVLYRLPELLAADPRKPVFVVEGEKDCDRLRKLEVIATTNAGGAGKWREEYNEPLDGRDVIVIPDNDAPGRDHALQVAKSVRRVAASVKVLELPNMPEHGDVSDWLQAGGTITELRRLAASSPPFEASSTKLTSQEKTIETPALRFKRMSDVEAKAVRWLWTLYMAIGALTFIEGPPGVGKSTLLYVLSAAITRGVGLPGMEKFEPRNVIVCSVEDNKSHTIRPRLDAAGADATKVFALDEPLTLDVQGILRLKAAAIEIKPAVIFLDPIFAFTGAKADINRANETRDFTTRLTALAEQCDLSIVGVRHLAKSRGGGQALNAGIGSIDLLAHARSVLLVGQDPDDVKKRALVQIKNNLGPQAPSLGFTLDEGNFYWTGNTDLTANRILSLPYNQEERSAVDEAVDFLRDSLADGDRETSEVISEAKRAGITEKTLRNGRERLKIRARREGLPGTKQRFFWALPDVEGLPETTKPSGPGFDELYIPPGATDEERDALCRDFEERQVS